MSAAKVKTELSILKRAWPWMLIGVSAQILHTWMHGTAYYLAGKYSVYGGAENQLVDLGFIYLPVINISGRSGIEIPNNAILYTLFGLLAIFFVAPFFFPHRLTYSPVSAGWRMLMVLTVSVLLRVTSFIVTLLPSPGRHCAQSPEGDFDPPTGAKGVLGDFNTDGGCGDLIFSGHMMYGLTAACVISSYLPYWWVRSVVWLMVFALGFVIVCQRSHYSIDVLVAWYTVPMVWITFRHFFPWDIKDQFFFWRDQPAIKFTVKSVSEDHSQSSDSQKV
jgi:hypothetical protein